MARVAWSLSVAHLLLALAVKADTSAVEFKSKCLAFTPESYVPRATLNRLEYVTAGTNLLFPDNDASCNRASQTVNVNMCRVALYISTSQRSGFHYELWLPEIWNGRTLATGNGGLDGC